MDTASLSVKTEEGSYRVDVPMRSINGGVFHSPLHSVKSTHLTLTSSCSQARTVASDNCISTWASRSSSLTSPTPSRVSPGNLPLHLLRLLFLLSTPATKTRLSRPPLHPSTHSRLSPVRPLLRDVAGQPGSTNRSLPLLALHKRRQ